MKKKQHYLGIFSNFSEQLFCRKVSNSTTKSQTVLQNQNDAILSMFQITFTDASLDFSYSSFFKIMIFSNRFSQWSLSVISPQSGLPEYWKLEIVLIYIWRQGRVRNAKFGTNASNEKLLMLQNVRLTVFTISVLLRGNQQGKITPFHPD